MRRENGLPPDSPFCHILGTCLGEPDVKAANDMIAALRSSAEAYLGGVKFCFSDLIIPDRDKSYQRHVVEGAVRAHGLRQTFPTLSAGQVAVIANDPRDSELPSEQITLAVDYSRSGLNLDLFCNDIGVVDPLTAQHEVGIGADNSDPAHWAAVSAALQRIAQSPFPRCPMGRKFQDRIHSLVLYGDSVGDVDFLHTITGVLGEDLVTQARARDPEFVSVLGAAELSFETHNAIDFRDQPAFGCRWRSGLYAAHPLEL